VRAQWKTLRTNNSIERVNEEFRRRVKTQGALPSEAAAVTLLFGLVATGQVVLRKLHGYTQLAAGDPAADAPRRVSIHQLRAMRDTARDGRQPQCRATRSTVPERGVSRSHGTSRPRAARARSLPAPGATAASDPYGTPLSMIPTMINRCDWCKDPLRQPGQLQTPTTGFERRCLPKAIAKSKSQ
jgi:hypothetical protein